MIYFIKLGAKIFNFVAERGRVARMLAVNTYTMMKNEKNFSIISILMKLKVSRDYLLELLKGTDSMIIMIYWASRRLITDKIIYNAC